MPALEGVVYLGHQLDTRPPIPHVTRMTRGSLLGVITIYDHPVTSAAGGRLNSKLQNVTPVACGSRNFDHLCTAIYFPCRGLHHHPVTHGISG
jgi:hypothetical protein